MKVQQRLPSPSHHSHAHNSVTASQNHAQAHPNGVHSEHSRPHYSLSDTGDLNVDNMNHYQNHYGNAAGRGSVPYQSQQQQPQHQYQPPLLRQQHGQYPPQNQLPPMQGSYPNMPPPPLSIPPEGIADAPSTSHQRIYPNITNTGLPQPGAHALEAQTKQGPQSLSGHNGKYRFELRVEQQPARARMCGFGDKDRRPITPPPCVRLLIFDVKTGEEVSHDDVDGSFFVLQVDLWDEGATREVNIVRSSSASPAISISTATTTSYPPTDRPGIQFYTDVHPGIYQTADGLQVFGAPASAGQPQLNYARNLVDPRSNIMPSYASSQYPPPGFQMAQPAPHAMSIVPVAGMPSSSSSTMFTRNLIGSLTVNAASLKDTDGNMGYWFVLQDLSVRTEGWFRLRMNFIDVGSHTGTGLNKHRAPVLAFVYSEKFQVYSAKKFPGVIESTSLSKCFAAQGIKIPIRKDTKGDKDDEEEE